MVKLTARIQSASSLCQKQQSQMYRLYASYYASTSFDLFQSDLQNKDFVVIMENNHQQIKGFSTLALIDFFHQGKKCKAIFSGDTIIDFDYWGQQALVISWVRFAGQIKYQQPQTPLFWFLIVKGHRTYRYLQAFCHTYYPCYHAPTPSYEKSILDRLATDRFGELYDAHSGLIKFKTSQGHLKSHWADISAQEKRRPEIQFFINQNPGYVDGDELACITELSEANLKPFARRLFLSDVSMNQSVNV